MPKEKPKENRRRFEEKERKAWTDEERKTFLERCQQLAPFIRHVTTPAVPEKKKDFLEELFSR